MAVISESLVVRYFTILNIMLNEHSTDSRTVSIKYDVLLLCSFNIISLIESISCYPILSLSHIMGPIISLIQHHKLASHCS